MINERSSRVSEPGDFDWDDVNVAQQDPEIEALAAKLMDMYGEVDLYDDDRDLYSDASALATAYREASREKNPGPLRPAEG